jgi:HEAT repeat protein
MLRDHPRSDLLGGYLPIALALLEYAPAADSLLELMQQSVRRPFVLQQCAIALGRMGDLRAAPLLHEMLQKSESMAVLSAVATGLGYLRDRRSIDPMIAVLGDQERTKLARAFAAAALGFIGDKDLLPWNAPIADSMNYMATVDTLTNGSTGVLDIL